MLKNGTMFFDLYGQYISKIKDIINTGSDLWYKIDSYLIYAERIETVNKGLSDGTKFLIKGMSRWSL